MKERTLPKVTKILMVIILILNLVLINFISLTWNLMVYAKDDQAENVRLIAYLKNEEGENTNYIEKPINCDEITLHIQIAVKNEGYLSGKIKLGSYFIFKPKDIEGVSEISDHEITLKQINAGEKIEFEVGIQPKLEDKIDSNFVNGKCQISLEGTYTNAEQKEINIAKSKNVSIVLANPYSDEEDKIKLESQIITNNIYEIKGENKRVLQMEIASGLEGEGYPIKQTSIELKLPEGLEDLQIESRGTIATNGKEEKQNKREDFSAIQKNNNITINIKNNEENEKIYYGKQNQDKILITAIYNAEKTLIGENIPIKSTIELYDKYQTKFEKEINTEVKEEKEQTIGYEIISEQEIYKGKMYAKEQEKYETTSKIDIRYPQIEEKIKIIEGDTLYAQPNKGKWSTKPADTIYTKSIIDKEKLLKVLGEKGQLYIKDVQENLIVTIDKNTQETDEGQIIIEYPQEYHQIIFEIENASNSGTIEIKHEKKIKTENNTKEELEKVTNLIEQGKLIQTEQLQEKTIVKNINLKEPETKINMQLNKTSLLEESNQNIEIQALLLTNNSAYDLYKNPKLEIEFPEQISEVSVNFIDILHDTNLNYEEPTIYQNEQGKNILSLQLTGEQIKHYEGEIVKGADVIINCNVSVNPLEESKSENIILKYSNENATQYSDEGIITTPIDYHLKAKEKQVISTTQIVQEQVTANQPVIVQKSTTVIDNDNNYIYEGQVQKYVITVKNNTNNAIDNLTITDDIPEQMIYCEAIKSEGYNNYFEEDETIDKYTKEIDTLSAGETQQFEYYTRVKQETSGNIIGNEAQVTIQGDKNIYKSDRIENEIKESKLQMDITLVNNSNGIFGTGDKLQYVIRVKNITQDEIKNIKIQNKLPDGLNYLSSQFLRFRQEDNKYYEDDENVLENKNYEVNNKTVTWPIDLASNEEVALKLIVEINEKPAQEDQANIYNFVKAIIDDQETYYSNIEQVNLVTKVSCTITKEVSKAEVYEQEEFEYTITVKCNSESGLMQGKLADEIPQYLTAVEATYWLNGEEQSMESVGNNVENLVDLNQDDEYKAIITVVAEDIPNDMQEVAVQNKASIEGFNMDKKESNMVTTVIKQNTQLQEENSNGGDTEEGENNLEEENNLQETGNAEQQNSISGTVWLDENENGRREEKEKTIANIQIALLDEQGNVIKEQTTNENGQYQFSGLENGKYIIGFKYDNSNYEITEYQSSGVEDSVNSDAIETQAKDNGQNILVGLTDFIIIQDDRAENIDLGLVQNNKFDLKLEKSISKVTVQDGKKVTEREYKNGTLAKIELNRKTVNDTTISINYKIKVVNEGDIAGYATNIIDYM